MPDREDTDKKATAGLLFRIGLCDEVSFATRLFFANRFSVPINAMASKAMERKDYSRGKESRKVDESENTLRIMEVVEAELEEQKRQATFCLTIFLCAISAWSLLIALWDYLGCPLDGEAMTLGVELIAVLMLVLVWKFTQLDIRKMGVSKKKPEVLTDEVFPYLHRCPSADDCHQMLYQGKRSYGGLVPS